MLQKLLFLISGFCMISTGLSWGPLGHMAVASIGQNGLTTNSQDVINSIIPEGNLSAVANWADQIRTQPGWTWSAPLHFINTPDWNCSYVPKRDCKNDEGRYPYCVDGAIQNYTTIFQKTLQPDSLKFLVHFVGDIHQPLHCGFTSDRGGNDISVSFNGYHTNLHSVWDSGIIEERIKRDFHNNFWSWVKFLINQSPPSPFSQGDSEIWGDDSVVLACSNAYINENSQPIQSGDTLTYNYYQRNIPIIESQIIKAGLRLSRLLNNLLNIL